MNIHGIETLKPNTHQSDSITNMKVDLIYLLNILGLGEKGGGQRERTKSPNVFIMPNSLERAHIYIFFVKEVFLAIITSQKRL